MENSEIKSVEFVFENCESVEIPVECFIESDFKDLKTVNGIVTFESFKCVIKDNDNIKYSSGGFDNKTPIQRINYYNDITNIYINYTDNSYIQIKCPWYDVDSYSESNDFQYSNIQTQNTIELCIINNHLSNSRWFSLNEILDNFENGQKVKDQDGKIYTICSEEDKGITYLFNTIVNNKILNSRFQKIS